MQMIAEVGADNNTTTIIMIPSDFVTMAKSVAEYVQDHQRTTAPAPPAPAPAPTSPPSVE